MAGEVGLPDLAGLVPLEHIIPAGQGTVAKFSRGPFGIAEPVAEKSLFDSDAQLDAVITGPRNFFESIGYQRIVPTRLEQFSHRGAHRFRFRPNRCFHLSSLCDP
jgi:hypothetical protein